MFHAIVEALADDVARRSAVRSSNKQQQPYPDCDGYTIYKHCTKELQS